MALQFAGEMVRRFDVDWAAAGYGDDDLTELAEHLLRIIQSFVIDPGRPPRTGERLRAYLRRWVGVAVKRWADVLYNNAGVLKMGAMAEATLADWNYTMRDELTVSFVAAMAAWPALVARTPLSRAPDRPPRAPARRLSSRR